MNQPLNGQRVRAIPSPGVQIQRSAKSFGQFLPPEGDEVIFDNYHRQRLQEGSLLVEA